MITYNVRMAKWLYNAIDSQSVHAGLSKFEAVDTLLRTGIRVYLLRDRHSKAAGKLRERAGRCHSAILAFATDEQVAEADAKRDRLLADAETEDEKAAACDAVLMTRVHRLDRPRGGAVMSGSTSYATEAERDADIGAKTSTAGDFDMTDTSYNLPEELVDAMTYWAANRFHHSQSWTFFHLVQAAFAVEALRQKGDTSKAYHEALLEIQETVLEFVRKADGDLVFISRR